MASRQENKIWAIVPAAGSGHRMGSGIPKQYLEIDGKCILQITLEALLGVTEIAEVLVCTSVQDKIWPTLEITENPKVKRCNGGISRAQSVMNGLLSLSKMADDNDWVLVHDAARPCITPMLIRKLINGLEHDQVGGILAVPAKDTLKMAKGDENIIESTINRDRVWHAQTPQMFRLGVLKNAVQHAINIGFEITDEASAVERDGNRVKLIEGDTRNLKITTPDDLVLAQAILASM